ncbi:unnamed protein product [Rotaria socialis]|uniref:VCBS repeat-containing protein n=1 Tax=Rotaria socialis TaxID=392032 RepID=A0A818NQ20_9BILA|nr:unnamed protein product [Rotaria socialis]
MATYVRLNLSLIYQTFVTYEGTYPTVQSLLSQQDEHLVDPMTAADLNGDGKPDIIVAVTGANTASVLLNTGNGTFSAQTTYLTGNWPDEVVVVDVNGDGKADIIVANYNSNNVGVLLNIGNGTFADQTTYSAGSGASCVAVVDVNGDGKPDIIVTNANSNNVCVLLAYY